jgi:hypothetical protein
MRLCEPLPDFLTVKQLHCWARQNAPVIRRDLTSQGVSASDLVWPILRNRDVQRAKFDWQNHRPFPTDDEILAMLLLMAPRDQEEMDDRGWRVVIFAIMIMAAPDPIPACMQVDLCHRTFAEID